MHVFYCDAGLIADRGHNATHARAIVRALRAKGVETTLLAHQEVADNLVDELGAQKFFSSTPFAQTSNDPLCGWLKSAGDVGIAFARDFARIRGLGPDSLILYDTTMPAPMLGIIQWMQRAFPPERAPQVFMSFVEHSGMRATLQADGRHELRVGTHEPVLYRYASTTLAPAFAARFAWGAYDPALAEVYSHLLQRPVRELPNPFHATTGCRDRTGTRGITVGFLGAQRPNKGFHLVPAIAAALLARRDDVRVLVQNSWSAMREQTAQIAELAKTNPRLELVDAPQDEAAWAQLLDRCDLLAAPYDVEQYAICSSGLMLEGLANAIPMVLAEDFSSTRVLQRFGMPGVTFKKVDVESVVAAIESAVAGYDELARRAVSASRQWQEQQGPVRLVEALMALLPANRKTTAESGTAT